MDDDSAGGARTEQSARRPRRRSVAKLAERQAKFEAKWRRRKFLEVLPLVGAYVRRSAPALMSACAQPGSAGPLVTISGTDDGEVLSPAPLAGAKRSCTRRASTSAGADEVAATRTRCAGGGGSADPVAGAAGPLSSGRTCVRVHDAWGSEQVQWHGHCDGGCGRADAQLFAMGSRWLCVDCWAIALSASLWAG